MIEITKIQMDYEINPVGVTQMPQFGWIIGGNGFNVIQEAYRLQIADSMQFQEENIQYDSMRVISEESAHVYLKDMELRSAHRYYVRVKIWDTLGEESEWSMPGYFVTALLHPNEWKGRFISAETKEDVATSQGTYVKHDFILNGKVKSAYAFTTALGLYHFYINGEKIGEDELTPGFTSYKKRLLYQTYEVTNALQEGNNVIAASLGAGWYKGKMGFLEERNNYGNQTAFLGQIQIEYEDGSTEIISTDESWQGASSPILFAEIYDGEYYDASLEQPKEWYPVEVVEYDKSVLHAQAGARVKQHEGIPARRILITPQGDKVIDFGQNLAGWIEVKAAGTKGARIELQCFEVLDAQGNVYLENLRGAKETITYICKEERMITYHPNFTYQGFRYARINAYPGEAKPEYFTARALYSDMRPTGTFWCSNPDINQLQSNILWSLKSNFVDIPTDCPQRNERVGWTGDAQIFCRTAGFLMNTYTFFSKWLKDVTADQTKEGGVPHIVPDLISGKEQDDWLLSQGTHSAAAWADVAVINPWILYLTYGDKQILEEQYDSMKKWIEFMRAHALDGIWNYKLQFGDWVALDAEEGSYFGATPNDLTCTAYYVYSTGLFAKIAKVLNRMEDYAVYDTLYQQIKQGFQVHFLDSRGNLTVQTQTAHIIALYFDLLPEDKKQQNANQLVQLLKREKGHLVTGFVGTPYFCHALSSHGYLKEAYELLLKDDFPSWLYQVKKGATTIWEHWDGLKPDGTMWSPDMNSFNHYAYGAIGEWLYRVVAGIEVEEENPGYKQAFLYPRIGGGLTAVKATYSSVYGELRLAWNKEKSKIILQIEIPHNTTAKIRLEAVAEITETAGIAFLSTEDGTKDRIGIAGSGSYEIHYDKQE
ncbi:MAG: family 78 glycoside hydrolase catalytic domain [Lachnospiraceae bacterium]